MHLNWPIVCSIGRSSPALMIAILSADLESGMGQKLQAAFSECWSEKPVMGSVPLSRIIQVDREDGCGHHGPEPDVRESGLTQHGIGINLDDWFDLPMLTFTSQPPKFPQLTTEDGVMMPDELLQQCKRFRNIVKFQGRDFFVTWYGKESGESGEERVDLVPLEFIAVDL